MHLSRAAIAGLLTLTAAGIGTAVALGQARDGGGTQGASSLGLPTEQELAAFSVPEAKLRWDATTTWHRDDVGRVFAVGPATSPAGDAWTCFFVLERGAEVPTGSCEGDGSTLKAGRVNAIYDHGAGVIKVAGFIPAGYASRVSDGATRSKSLTSQFFTLDVPVGTARLVASGPSGETMLELPQVDGLPSD